MLETLRNLLPSRRRAKLVARLTAEIVPIRRLAPADQRVFEMLHGERSTQSYDSQRGVWTFPRATDRWSR